MLILILDDLGLVSVVVDDCIQSANFATGSPDRGGNSLMDSALEPVLGLVSE
jgi:hypothetical protein